MHVFYLKKNLLISIAVPILVFSVQCKMLLSFLSLQIRYSFILSYIVLISILAVHVIMYNTKGRHKEGVGSTFATPLTDSGTRLKQEQ